MAAAQLSPRELARRIDHTLLKPEATAAQIEQLCAEAREHDFFAACVNPYWVPRCVRLLSGSTTVVATVAGFPLGASTAPIKALEAQLAVEQGAREVDMVVNLAALQAGEEAALTREISAVVAAVRDRNSEATVKVILETALLSDEAIKLGCNAAAAGGAAFVKTSTGFHPAGGAQAAHVRLMKQHANGLRVKAAGGIRDLQTAREMLAAGADRLGMSASVAVMRALQTGGA
jgi:deoxyribose-phosphate aldolase